MLKTITKSSNKKLGGCAATYRSGLDNVYSTCPSTCVLKPSQAQGSATINAIYLEALINAVPRDGVSWTYTHFPKEQIPITTQGQTCINISTDTAQEALESIRAGYPTVTVRPASEEAKVDVYEGVRFVRCPAEYLDTVTCNNCGGDRPLCARTGRDYVIKFTAHGAQAKKIEVRNQASTTLNLADSAGGCYGNGGPVRLQWEKTKGSTENDAQVLTTFVSTLPARSKIRHHVVGDIG